MTAVVGIDLGGTGLRVGVVQDNGALTPVRSFRHGGYPRPQDAIELIARSVALVTDGIPYAAVGLGVAAWVERDTGFIARAPNLGWIDVPFGEMLAHRLGVPVVVNNDLKAIAWGEYRFGSGQSADTLLVVFLGTGVGAAVVSGGALWVGSRGFGGEIGHVKVGPDDGPLCGCGRRGCLESYVGGGALARRSDELRTTGLLTVPPEVTQITVEDLDTAARQGNVAARSLLENGGNLLGRVLGSMITFLNPDVLLLGGGVWSGSDTVREAVREGIDVSTHPDLRKSVRLVESALGTSAGVLGAADLARKRLTPPAPGATH